MRLFLLIASFFALTTFQSCNSSSKIPCPTYADSTPEKKHKGKPGSQKPEIPKPAKARSGVLPTDGGGKRMRHTN